MGVYFQTLNVARQSKRVFEKEGQKQDRKYPITTQLGIGKILLSVDLKEHYTVFKNVPL